MRKRSSFTFLVFLIAPIVTLAWQSTATHAPKAPAPHKPATPTTSSKAMASVKPVRPPTLTGHKPGSPNPGVPEIRRPDNGSQNSAFTTPVGAQPDSVPAGRKSDLGDLSKQTANQTAVLPAEGPAPNLGEGNGGKETPVGTPPSGPIHSCTPQNPCPKPRTQSAPKPAPKAPDQGPKQ